MAPSMGLDNATNRADKETPNAQSDEPEKVIPKKNFIQIQKSHKNFKKLSKTVNIVPHNLKNLFTKIFENNLFEFSVNV